MLLYPFSFLLLLITTFLLLLLPAFADFTPAKRYFINCGSTNPVTTEDNRIFAADNSKLGYFESSSADSTSLKNPSPPTSVDDIYATARVFTTAYWYSFQVPLNFTLFLRLHFLPFKSGHFDLRNSSLRLSTSDNILLLCNFTVTNTTTPTVKEYLLRSPQAHLNLTFKPSDGNSAAFVNAIELFTAPPNFTNSTDPRLIGFRDEVSWSSRRAMEKLYRVNAGGPPIQPGGDPLWRSWVNDQSFLFQSVAASDNSTNETVQYADSLVGKRATAEVAPKEVYNTLKEMNIRYPDASNNFNITWKLDVAARYRYLVRLHFCDFVSSGDLVFNVFINSEEAYPRLRPSEAAGGDGKFVPFFIDFATDSSSSSNLNITIGSTARETRGNAILNGFEVFKVNNSVGSLDGDRNPLYQTPGGSSKSYSTAIIGGAAAAAVVLAVLVLVGCFVFHKKKKKKTKRQQPAPPLEMKDSTSAWTNNVPGAGEPHSMSTSGSATVLLACPAVGLEIRLDEVRLATDGFDERRVIGCGGFGKVYRGELRNGTPVAIKCASPNSRQGYPEFRNEIAVLSQIRHRHLVALVGYCDEGGIMALVYEYMPRGTLKDLLKTTVTQQITWTQRLEVCIGAARGLHYLHTGFTHSIIHRDVKSSNILLAEDYAAKVADFGLSRVGPTLGESHVSTAVKGSFGYLDPEYFRTQKLTHKSDVYSFGVVLFELLCGRPVIDPKLPREEVNLAEWASRKTAEGKVEEIVDPRLGRAVAAGRSARKLAETAARCLMERGHDRPAIGDVLWNLEYALQLHQSEERGESISVTRDAQIPDVALPVRRGASMGTDLSHDGRSDLTESSIFSQLITNEGR